MLLRIPARREHALQLLPSVIEQTGVVVAQEFSNTELARGTAPFDIERRIATELVPTLQRFKTEPPAQLIQRIRNPLPTPLIVEAILAMNWMIIKAPPSRFFVTGDNPAFFPIHFYLDTEDSELVFPLSPSAAFHGSLAHGSKKLGFITGSRPVIIELNRRIALNATRFTFCHERADWLLRLMKRAHHPFRPIRFRW